MAIEYVPLNIYTEEHAQWDRAFIKVSTAKGLLRLQVFSADSTKIDFCLDAEDLWRAWQAVKPNAEEWP